MSFIVYYVLGANKTNSNVNLLLLAINNVLIFIDGLFYNILICILYGTILFRNILYEYGWYGALYIKG